MLQHRMNANWPSLQRTLATVALSGIALAPATVLAEAPFDKVRKD